MGKGGGGGPTQTTSTVQNTNIPQYAQPYVESMLGATQEQLFQGTRTPTVTNPETGEVTGGEFNITGFKPYQAYGGTYDAQGNQTAYDPSKAVAGFQPLQEAAQRGIGSMQLDPRFASAAQRADQASLDAIRTASIAADYGQAGQRSGLAGQKLGLASAAEAQALARQQAATPVQTTSTQPSYGVTLANGNTVMGGQVPFYNPAIEQAQITTPVQSSVASTPVQLTNPLPTPLVLAPTTNPTPAQSGNLGIINPATLGPVVSPQAMNSTAGGVASLVAPQVQAQTATPTPVATSKPVQNQQAAPVWWQQMGYSSPQEAMDVGGFDASAFR